MSFCSPAEISFPPNRSPLSILSVPTFLLLSTHKLDLLDFPRSILCFCLLSLYVMLCSGKFLSSIFQDAKSFSFWLNKCLLSASWGLHSMLGASYKAVNMMQDIPFQDTCFQGLCFMSFCYTAFMLFFFFILEVTFQFSWIISYPLSVHLFNSKLLFLSRYTFFTIIK